MTWISFSLGVVVTLVGVFLIGRADPRKAEDATQAMWGGIVTVCGMLILMASVFAALFALRVSR